MPAEQNNKHTRYAIIDLLRGIAIAMMFSYHFAWDLNNFRLVELDFYQNPFWLHYRTAIVSLFLLVMGTSLQLAHHQRIRLKPFLRRLYWLIACALIISISTYIYNGQRYIYFGILHFIAVASVLGLLFVRFYWLNLVLGLGIIVAGISLQHAIFDPKMWNWIGFVTSKPLTDDYVPLFPWFGVVLLGMFIARLVFQERPLPALMHFTNRSAVSRLLQFGGRHSLLIYMLHQPLFIGLLTLLVSLS
jgi:uncharacterized membrane protein